MWEPAVKDRFTDQVLDRLGYEWDPASRVFAPVIGEECVDDMKRAARTITSVIDAELSEPLRNRVEGWCRLYGVESFDTEPARTLVARQALLGILLKETVSEWCRKRDAVPPRATESRPACQDGRLQAAVLAFDEVLLEHVAGLADETALAAVRTHAERLLYSAQPDEDIGWLYEAITPKACRQGLGQFRTPPSIADVLRRWVSDGSDVVLDPGIGTGALSCSRFTNWTVSSEPDRVYGIDQSPLSRLMGAVTLTLTG